MCIYLIFICIYIYIVTSIEFTARSSLDTNTLPSLHLYIHIPRTYIHKYICMTYHTHTRIYIHMYMYMYILFLCTARRSLDANPLPSARQHRGRYCLRRQWGSGRGSKLKYIFLHEGKRVFLQYENTGSFHKSAQYFQSHEHALTSKRAGCTHGCNM